MQNLIHCNVFKNIIVATIRQNQENKTNWWKKKGKENYLFHVVDRCTCSWVYKPDRRTSLDPIHHNPSLVLDTLEQNRD